MHIRRERANTTDCKGIPLAMSMTVDHSNEFLDNQTPMFTPPTFDEQNILVHNDLVIIPNMTIPVAPPVIFPNLTLEEKAICASNFRYCTLRLVVDVFLMGPMCTAGLLGNFLAILALRMEHSNRTMTFLLQALAFADNGYLISCLFLHSIKTMVDCTTWTGDFRNQFPFWEPYLWPLASIAQTSTVWLTVLVTVDRFVAICRPFESMRHQVSTRARRAVYLIVLLAILYNIPRFFEQKIEYLPDYCRRIMRYFARHSELRKNRLYFIIYKTIMFLLFRMTAPLVILVTLNMKLIQALRVARRDHAKLTQTSNQKSQDYFTLILVIVVTVFIMCQTPDFLLRIAVTIRVFTNLDFSVAWINVFTNMLLAVNSSVNCLIYCLTGRRFRQILKKMLCRTCLRRASYMNDDHRYGNSDMTSAGYSKRQTSMSGVGETCV